MSKNEAEKNYKELAFRYLIFICGLFVASLGVAFSTKAELGTSPVASVPYSVSLVITSISFGNLFNMLSVIQIIVQILLLRSKCKPVEIIIQTLLAFAYGYLTDFSCYLIRGIRVDTYLIQFLLMLVGCVVVGLGIWIQLRGGVAMLPGEAMNRAISQVTGKKYENIKILFDVIYILISAVISLIFFGELKGVREGSIVAALAIGNIIRLFNRIYARITNSGKDTFTHE